MSPGTPAATPQSLRPTLLMCPPHFFDVRYVINPWMQGNVHLASHAEALTQWKHLHETLSAHADVLLIEPKSALPDMVFTANAALVKDGVALLSRFRCTERRGEEKHFRAWLKAQGYMVHEMPPDIAFEGEGDALWTPGGARLWVGHGWRTSSASLDRLRALWPASEIVPLRLIDPRFYHLDTCFAVLAGGEVLYFPPAFDATSCAAIEAFYPEQKRIAISEADAIRFACNAVHLGQEIVLNRISPSLLLRLNSRGYQVTEIPLDEFMKAGGAAKCLVLRLTDPAMT